MAQIVITLQPTSVPGQFRPQVDLVDMTMPSPAAAWQTAVDALLLAARIAHQEHRKLLQGAQPRVLLADVLPQTQGGLH